MKSCLGNLFTYTDTCPRKVVGSPGRTHPLPPHCPYVLCLTRHVGGGGVSHVPPVPPTTAQVAQVVPRPP